MQHKSVVPLSKKLGNPLHRAYHLYRSLFGRQFKHPGASSSIKHVIVDTDVDSDDAMAIILGLGPMANKAAPLIT